MLNDLYRGSKAYLVFVLWFIFLKSIPSDLPSTGLNVLFYITFAHLVIGRMDSVNTLLNLVMKPFTPLCLVS